MTSRSAGFVSDSNNSTNIALRNTKHNKLQSAGKKREENYFRNMSGTGVRSPLNPGGSCGCTSAAGHSGAPSGCDRTRRTCWSSPSGDWVRRRSSSTQSARHSFRQCSGRWLRPSSSLYWQQTSLVCVLWFRLSQLGCSGAWFCGVDLSSVAASTHGRARFVSVAPARSGSGIYSRRRMVLSVDTTLSFE